MEAASAIGPVMQLVGVGLNTYSQVAASNVQAKFLQAQARSTEEQATFDERQFRRNASPTAGSSNAASAASDIDITRSSALFEQLDLAKQSKTQAQKHSGQIAANNTRFDARMVQRQISLTLRTGLQKGQYLNQIGREMTPSPGHIVAATHTTPTGRDKWLGHCPHTGPDPQKLKATIELRRCICQERASAATKVWTPR